MEPTRTAPYRLKATWWLTQRHYLIFMLRELSPVFISICFVRILGVLAKVPYGPAAVEQAWAALATPASIAFGFVSLAFAFLHSVTFFQAGAVIMPLKIGGKPVPGALMVLGNLGAMAAIAVALIVAVVKL